METLFYQCDSLFLALWLNYFFKFPFDFVYIAVQEPHPLDCLFVSVVHEYGFNPFLEFMPSSWFSVNRGYTVSPHDFNNVFSLFWKRDKTTAESTTRFPYQL